MIQIPHRSILISPIINNERSGYAASVFDVDGRCLEVLGPVETENFAQELGDRWLVLFFARWHNPDKHIMDCAPIALAPEEHCVQVEQAEVDAYVDHLLSPDNLSREYVTAK